MYLYVTHTSEYGAICLCTGPTEYCLCKYIFIYIYICNTHNRTQRDLSMYRPLGQHGKGASGTNSENSALS